MDKNKYYGCENPESVSYLEFGSINLVKGEKKIWNYWQDQDAYDLYMFARYARDLFAFRKFFGEKDKTVEKLNGYVLESAHNKLMDYIFKYAGMLAAREKGMVCECGSSLYGWIDEALACDEVYGGHNAEKIRGFHYIGSDISALMNEGAANFHKDVNMDFSTQDTISGLIKEIKEKFLGEKLSLFYGLSVSVRYAVRDASDLMEVADAAELSIYNRLSMTLEEKTQVSVYGTGKSVYLISLPKLLEGLKEKGLFVKYCTANMQYGKDGDNTVRVSLAIADRQELLEQFIAKYEECIGKSIQIESVVKGEWKDPEELLLNR